MGLLKHFILPLFALTHLVSIHACMDLGRWAEIVGLSSIEFSQADWDSSRQWHMLGALKGFNAAMAMLCLVGFLQESAHFRGFIMTAEAILYAVVTLDAFSLGLNFYVPGAFATIALVGLVLHSMEPGLFTKDKTKTKDK